MKKRFNLVTILLLIIFCGAIFSGCGPDYGSLSLSLNVDRIDMSITDEATDYFITIDNYFDFDAQFDFSFSNQVAKIVDDSITHRGNGLYSFSIIPLVADSGILTITLKGLDKPLTVPIVVTSEVTSITNLKSAYVWRGQSVKLDNSYFTFLPQDTKQKGITFDLPEEYETQGVTLDANNNLYVADSCTLEQITLTAISTYNANISCQFVVNVISEIDTTNLLVSIADQDTENVNEFGEFTPIDIQEETPYEINLVVSEQTGFQKKLSVAYDLWAKGYAIDIISTSNLSVGSSGVCSILGKTQNFDFIVTASDVGVGEIVLKVYQADVEENYKTFTIKVKITCKPNQIAVNGQANLGLIELYTNGEEVKDYAFSIFPSKADKNDYSYAISFYESNAGVKDITGEFNENFSLLTSVPSEFIKVSYGGVEILSSELNAEHILELTDKLTSNLSLQAIKATSDKFLAIKVDCIDDTEIACSAVMYIKVYVGTTEFKIDDKVYANNTIYLSLEDGAQTFYGIECSEGSTPGRLTISSLTSGVSICDIEQLSNANAYLTITPKEVGEQEFMIATPNNLSLVLKVVVVGVIAESDFSLQIADTTNSGIAGSTLGSLTNSLETITLKGIGSYVNIQSQITKNIKTNANTYTYELSLTEEQKQYFSITNNSLITSKKLTKLYDDEKDEYFDNGIDLTVKVTINKVDSFHLIPQDLNHDYSINLKCVNYIKELTLYASADETGSSLAREADIYNKGDLSYVNQNLSNVYLFMNLVQSETEIYKGLTIDNFKFPSNSAGTDFYNLVQTGEGSYKVGEIGYFFFNSEAKDNGYIGNFIYDYSSIRTISQITIILSITDYSTGTLFSSYVTLKVQEYIDVDSIWLSTPTDVVYLDNTDTYNQVTMTVQIMPADAMCKDLDILIDTNDTNCIGVDIVNNTITFTYQNAGSGRILIFPVSKMKTNSYTDANGEYYYHLALDFRAADGLTEETALKISSYNDLRSINANYHYYVDSTIDCQGNVLDIAELKGSIRGTFLAESQEGFENSQQIGSIINFVLSQNVEDGNVGLIRKLTYTTDAQTGAIIPAKVYNLSLSGVLKADTILEDSIDYAYKFSESANVGFLCGLNQGEIKNVTLNITENQSSTFASIASTAITLNVGLLVGLNEGLIQVNSNCKNFTLLVNNTSSTYVNVNFVGENLSSFFGGIVGLNKGEISQELPETQITIGLYGISANVFASSNATHFGGVVGENAGKVSGLKVTGEIKSLDKNPSAFVAGFAGKLTSGEVKNNTIRVFVRGKNNVSGFAGETTAFTGTLTNNKVQAPDDGTRKSLDASFVIGYGDDSEIYAISKDAISGVIAETYFVRSLPAALIETLRKNSIGAFNEVNLVTDGSSGEIIYKVNLSLSEGNYYGDMIKVKENVDEISPETIYLTLRYINYRNSFVEGQEATLGDDTSFVLASFLQAVNSENQVNVANLLDSVSLLKYSGVLGDGTVKDINITILTPLVASIADFGKNIKLLSTGQLNLVISSSLNYQETAKINLYITNYYDGIKLYTNKDKTQEVNTIELINKKTTIVYFDCYANSYNYKNTPIELVSNAQVTFDFAIPDEYKDLFNAEVYGQTGFLVVKELAEGEINVKQFESSISFTSKLIVNNLTYYKNNVLDPADRIKLDHLEIGASPFILNTDSKFDIANCELETRSVVARTGIEEIKLSKSVVEVEPSDSVEVSVTYNSFNLDDELVPTLQIYKNGKWQNYVLRSGKFMSSDEKPLFTLEKGAISQIGTNKYTVNYTLQMCLEDMDVYESLKNCKLLLTFSSKFASSQYAQLTVEYTPENISSLLVINYNKDTNAGMLTSKDGIISVHPEEMIYSGKQVSTGEQNIINAHVYTRYSEFEYVDVKLNIGVDGGYLAAIEYEEKIDEGGNKISVGKISNNSVYTSITGGATLRIYKQYLKQDPTNNTIVICLLYKIPKTIVDGTVVTISFDFYNQGQVCFNDQISLHSRLSDQVSFEIVDKQPVQELEDAKVYNVVRGKKYLLDTTIVGYTDDQVKFESTDPSVATVVKEGTNYYLYISNTSIAYGEDGYYEVEIKSFGEKKSQAQVSRSVIKTTRLRIYEILVELNTFNGENQINLRMLETVKIKDLIANKIQFEYSPSVTSIEAVMNAFRREFANNADFYFMVNNSSLLLKDFSSVNVRNQYKLSQNEEGETLFTPLNVDINYSFNVKYFIEYENGLPKAIEIDEDVVHVNEADFNCVVFLSSAQDTPNPIYNYQDMLKMNEGEHYRQVDDITISANELQMITTRIASFDGNGYTITINPGTVNVALDSSSNFALFQTLNEDSILQNVSIVVAGNLTLTLNNSLNSSGANIALLVAENSGIITNCSVKSTSIVTADIISTVSVMENSYFAGLCAVNTGYITHCQVECNLTANGASLGGVVANNSGHISSTYVKNSRLYNTSSTTNENIVTGGFVTINSGKILMSYIEGASSTNRIYADYVANDYSLHSKIIYTATKVGGFVYNNSGIIKDSYSNIPIVSSNSASGFVGINSGEITRTFSLCKLKHRDTLNYGFVISYEQTAQFIDCFFVIQDNLINYNTSETNYKYNSETREFESVIDGITPLEVVDFDMFEYDNVSKSFKLKENSPFNSFIKNSDNTSGVWFYAYNEVQNKQANNISLVQTYSCEVEGIENYKGEKLSFVARRLQLVSPNLVSYSQYALEYGTQQGEYVYTSTGKTTLGSKSNPYLITSAKAFEDYCHQRNVGSYEYFRLVTDIDYLDEEIYSSKLYDKILLGYFEGNGLSISNYSINSISSLLSSGLFSQIGSAGSTTSCFKNVTLNPLYINVPNCIFVGGLAGTAVNVNIYNVNIENNEIVVVGNNVVGGLIGRTMGETRIDTVYSNITAKASYYNALVLQTSEDEMGVIRNVAFNENGTNNNKVSYAGAIAGYIGGITNVRNANIGNQAKSMGMVAGLMYGGIGSLSEVYDFDLVLNSFENQVSSYAFGGLIAGELTGRVRDFSINSRILSRNTFTCYPVTPLAIGGVAGLMRDGEIYNLSSDYGYSVIGARIISQDAESYLIPHNPYIVKFVGGLVGYGIRIDVNNVNIGSVPLNGDDKVLVNSNVTGNGIALMGGNYVGGVVGFINGNAVNEFGTANTEGEDGGPLYYVNSYVSNVKLNIVSTKTYINENDELKIDKVYSSYVSAAVGEAIDYYLNEDQHFGLVYGWSRAEGATGDASAGACPLALKDGDVTNDTSNSVILEKGCRIYFAKYEKFTWLEPVEENKNNPDVAPNQMNYKVTSERIFNAKFADYNFDTYSEVKNKIADNITFVMIDFVENISRKFAMTKWLGEINWN